ncbi:MAG: hypothetical protein ACI83B_001771 [Sediminicola sp.]
MFNVIRVINYFSVLYLISSNHYDNEDIENIDAWLESNRRINRISYMKMCNVIGYSDTGFKSALTNNRLPMPLVLEIIEKFGWEDDFNKEFSLNDDEHHVKTVTENEHFILEVMKRHKELISASEIYKSFIDGLIAKEVWKVTSSKENYQEYFKFVCCTYYLNLQIIIMIFL